MFLSFAPARHFMHQELTQGRLPLWNPLILCGVPFLASMQTAVLFPINLLLSPIDPFRASGLAAFLKLFLAGGFMFLYLRGLGASRAASTLSGVSFALSGFMVCWLGHPHANSALWLPLSLHLLEKGLKGPRVWAVFAVAYAFIILGGHPPTIVHASLFLLLYGVFKTRERPLLLLSSLLMGALLAAPQLLPFLEYARHSSMAEASAGLARASTRLEWTSLLSWVLPSWPGAFADNFNERTGYVGLLPLALALFSFPSKEKSARFHAVAAVLALAAVYGLFPWPQIFGSLPVLRDINPTRLLLVADLSFCVLAGLAFDRFKLPRLLILLAAADLLHFAYGRNPAVPREQYYPETPALTRLRLESQGSRVLGLKGALPPNTGMMFGLQDVRGVDFMSLRSYEELINGSVGRHSFYFYSAALELPKALPLLDVSHILLEDRVVVRKPPARALAVFSHEVIFDPQARLDRLLAPDFDPAKAVVFEEDPGSASAAGTVPLPAVPGAYEAPGAAGSGEVRVVRYASDEVVVSADMSVPGWLVLFDSYYPGWKARVNGKRARVLRADHCFRAVALPAGTSTVRFAYRPASFLIGTLLAAAALACVGFVCLKRA
ncbi:MAG: YfhO family protein [Elusimicrobiota bacterium]